MHRKKNADANNMTAVCIKCGNFKNKAIIPCSFCGFSPESDEEKAKSIMLSTDYEINNEYKGKSIYELQVISNDLKKGKEFSFDDKEVKRLVRYARYIDSISWRELLVDLIRWLFVPICVLLLVFVLLRWNTIRSIQSCSLNVQARLIKGKTTKIWDIEANFPWQIK